MQNIELKAEGDPPEDDANTIVQKALTDLTATVETRVGALETKQGDFDKLVKRFDAIEVKLARPGAVKPDDTNEQAKLETKSFTTFIRRGREALGADEIKSLRISDDTSGGYLAPAEFSAEVDKNIVQFSPVRQAARVGSTSSGSVIVPRRTGAPTAAWVGETETRSATQAAYGQVEIPIDEIACYVDVSNKLLEDAAVDVASEVAFDLAEEFGRAEGAAFISGDGVKKPLGLINDAGLSYTASGVAAALTDATHNGVDACLDLFYGLAPFYRARGVWMANGKTIATLRKIKDTTGQYLWQPPVVAGQPASFLGSPIVEAVDLDDIGANKFPILFGDFASAFRIYDRIALSLLRDPYSQATSGLTRFHARRRVGARVVRPEAIRKLKISAS